MFPVRTEHLNLFTNIKQIWTTENVSCLLEKLKAAITMQCLCIFYLIQVIVIVICNIIYICMWNLNLPQTTLLATSIPTMQVSAAVSWNLYLDIDFVVMHAQCSRAIWV